MNTVFWQKHPALRLLLPFCAGIWLQRQLSFGLVILTVPLITFLVLILAYHFFAINRKFFLNPVHGFLLQLLIFNAGLLVLWKNDAPIEEKKDDFYQEGMRAASVLEPLSEKKNSYKTVAGIRSCKDPTRSATAIIYLNKDTNLISSLRPGSIIIFRKPVPVIRNSGNPGSFDYKGYCRIQGITHQVYLKSKEFEILPEQLPRFPDDLVYSVRSNIIGVLRQNIPGKKEQGLAEALLIGYRDDLDKSLVQAYANTGVVHVIAISGLHLGIIYGILVFVTSAFNRKGLYWLRFLLVMGGLWAFTLIAGAQASVLRSAVMFSFVAAGVVLKRNGSVINSLALSALLLLCWKPQWLWDVGFQLSYSAVLSIVLYFKHVYGWLFLKNKIADSIWKLTAVTISSQFLTIPLTLFYFHQFPVLLLFTNLVAVPLSGIILIGEIILISISWLKPVADLLGMLLGKLIGWMNYFIESSDQLPFNTWTGIELSEMQVIFLYGTTGFMSVWLLAKKKSSALLAAACLLAFFSFRSYSFLSSDLQAKLVVYNIPRVKAADLIGGRQAIFFGNDSTLASKTIAGQHLVPSWRMYRVSSPRMVLDRDLFLSVNSKTILFLSGKVKKLKETDVLIVSGNASPLPDSLLKQIQKCTVVLDASLSFRRRNEWKKKLMELKIRFHDVKDNGAFVMNL